MRSNEDAYRKDGDFDEGDIDILARRLFMSRAREAEREGRSVREEVEQELLDCVRTLVEEASAAIAARHDHVPIDTRAGDFIQVRTLCSVPRMALMRDSGWRRDGVSFESERIEGTPFRPLWNEGCRHGWPLVWMMPFADDMPEEVADICDDIRIQADAMLAKELREDPGRYPLRAGRRYDLDEYGGPYSVNSVAGFLASAFPSALGEAEDACESWMREELVLEAYRDWCAENGIVANRRNRAERLREAFREAGR